MLEPRSEPPAPVGIPDRELVISRVIAAPPHLVFAAWTSAEHLPRWYGPRGFSTTVHAMDVRPGGTTRLTMRGPDGVDYPNTIAYDEVSPPSRLVFTTRGGRTDRPPEQHQHVVTFDPEGAGTRVTMRLVFASAAAKAANLATYHSDEGSRETLERLAQAMDELVVRGTELVLSRTFDAPRALVWEAFTQPEHVKRWLAPPPLTLPVFEVDLRPGGALRMVMRAPDGTEFPSDGTVTEVVPRERYGWRGTIHDGIEVDTVVTLSGDGDRTTLTVHQTYSKVGAPTLGAKMGWLASLDALDAVVRSLTPPRG